MRMLRSGTLLALLILTGGMAISQTKKTVDSAKKAPARSVSNAKPDKYHDNVDDRIKGPNGEKIYIGPNGGRYYIKNGNKVYVPLKRKKNAQKK